MNRYYPPTPYIKRAANAGYKWLFLDKHNRWFASTNEIEFNSITGYFNGVSNNSTIFIGDDNGRSTFHYSESMFNLREWAMKNRQSPDEPSITLTLNEAREMIDAITKSVEGLFPNTLAENMWIGSPFKKLATFVDSHEEEDDE